MNKLVALLVLIVVLPTFLLCSSSKLKTDQVVQQNHPFKVVKATFTRVELSQAESEIIVHLTVNNSEIKLDTLFFRNRRTALKRQTNSIEPLFTGKFILNSSAGDLNLESDPKKEFGNKAPVFYKKIPFELTTNEAVISYSNKKGNHYYKIDKVVEVSTNSN